MYESTQVFIFFSPPPPFFVSFKVEKRIILYFLFFWFESIIMKLNFLKVFCSGPLDFVNIKSMQRNAGGHKGLAHGETIANNGAETRLFQKKKKYAHYFVSGKPSIVLRRSLTPTVLRNNITL